MRRRFLVGATLLVLFAAAGLARVGAESQRFNEQALEGFTYRNLGPFRAGAWVSDIAVPDSPVKSHLYTMYVALRYGGVWKTINNGTTFTPVFDSQGTLSIGALAIAPSNENIVWVGTGDASSVRVTMNGDGVYKSTDAGASWQKMGLDGSSRIARIVIHPTNPEIVYVAAMGRLWSPNEERGVFKSTDGGKSWRRVLYVNDKTGVIDLVMNRRRPELVYAATYEVQRYPWRLEEGGGGTGIYRTADGGASWERLGGGLPTGPVGRIGLDIFQKNPDVLYAVLENLSKRFPTEEEARRDRDRGLAPRERQVGGELYRTDDGGRTWQKMNGPRDDLSSKAGYSFNQVRVDPANDRRVLINSDALLSSDDGGRTWKGLTWESRQLFRNAFGDFRTMWIDPQNSDRMIMGSDGGVHVSYDGGATCDHYLNLPGGEFYAIAVDLDDPYRIYGGLQDHDSWRGPSNGWSGRVGPEDWVTVGDNDGMYNQVDPTDSRWVYNTYQWGGHHRADLGTLTRKSIEPKRADGAVPLRFNWTPPLVLSPHNSRILYTGAQVLLRSVNQGEDWEEISPDLTTNDASRISPPGSTVQYCTITTISESSRQAGVIWTGTDDGKVQLSRNHGASWTDATGAIAAVGGPAHYWVTRVVASRHAAGTAYVTKSGHRFDRLEPLVFKTADFGATWTAIQSNLPPGPVNVMVEDPVDANLLFAGTHLGVYVSRDGGGRWVRMKANMPNVAVTDLVVHPREGDLVVATYGRGVFVTHVAAIREMTPDVLGKALHLFTVRQRARRAEGAWGNFQLYGDRYVTTPNEPNGPVLEYWLGEKHEGKARVTVRSADGTMVKVLEGPADAGLNRSAWDGLDEKERVVEPGDYLVTVEVGALTATGRVRLLPPREARR